MPKFTDSLIGENLEVATEYFKSLMAASNTGKKDKTSGGSIGFIPFNTTFAMDGLSGIKIYNELTIDSSFFPIGYSKTLDLVITGVDHKLKDGDWETTIQATAIPKTSGIEDVITGSLSVTSQQESYTPPPTNNTNNTNNTGGGGRGRPPGVTGDNARLPDSDLVLILTKSGQEYKLYKDAATGYNILKAAAAAAGYNLDNALTSAYRDYAKQEKLYNDYLAHRSPYLTGKPGESNHGWGRAIDVSSSSPVLSWLKRNCVKYNWYWFGPNDKIHFTFGYNESGRAQEPQDP
jgi:hypothetical protein